MGRPGRGYYARRGLRAELAFFWRLTWPGFAFIVALNSLLDVAGQPSAPLWFTTPGGLVAMLAAAYWRDYHRDGDKIVELHPDDRMVIHVIRKGQLVDVLSLGGDGQPNPLRHLPFDAPFVELASAAIIEYLVGDLSIEELDAVLDWYLRGIG